MSSVQKQPNDEFEDEFQLQRAAAEREKLAEQQTKKTRRDEDGTVMEWDEEKRAWFPKIDDDFIASYQMNFGVIQESEEDAAHSAWRKFAAQVERLKQEKGAEDEEVKRVQASLEEYYRSSAYRAWYESYRMRLDEHKRVESQPPKKANLLTESSADEALKRAEEEQRMGVPIQVNSEESGSLKEKDESIEAAARKRRKKGPPAWYEITDDKNTHVYVSGLPPSITEAGFTELMTKCGIIMNDPLSDKLRVKLYRDADGKPKGDGRCCYIKIESVDLAMQILDGLQYEPGYVLHVERAKFQPREGFDHTKHRRLTAKEKKKFKKKQENLFKWKPDSNKLIRSKKERVVILRGVFDETDLGLDVSLIPEIRERVRVQCAKVGIVKKIVVYDTNPEGVVSVTFSTPEEADVSLTFLDQALFTYPAPNTDPEGGQRTRQLDVARWDGKERFDKSESTEEEQERIDRWTKFLEDDASESETETFDEQKVEQTDTDDEILARGSGDSGAETD